MKPSPQITILVDTVPRGKYRGHFAVTRSLIEGLQKSNLPLVYNPILNL